MTAEANLPPRRHEGRDCCPSSEVNEHVARLRYRDGIGARARLWENHANLWVSRTIKRDPTIPLKIQVLHAQGVLLDELAPRLDHISHQFGKEIVGLGHILHAHLQQGAGVGVESGLP